MTGTLAANLRYATSHSPSLDIHVELTPDGAAATVTTETGEHSGSGADAPEALQRALGEIGL